MMLSLEQERQLAELQDLKQREFSEQFEKDIEQISHRLDKGRRAMAVTSCMVDKDLEFIENCLGLIDQLPEEAELGEIVIEMETIRVSMSWTTTSGETYHMLGCSRTGEYTVKDDHGKTCVKAACLDSLYNKALLL
jgi:hypothetical protein